MKDQEPISRPEYAVLSPVERHTKLVELYQLLPKSNPDHEWFEAMDKSNAKLKEHNEAVRNGLETNEDFWAYVSSEEYSSDRDNLDALREKGDQERERRLNSEDKQHIAGEVTGLLEFSPTTDEFKKTVIKFFDYSYDNGTEVIDPNDLSHAILVKDAESGGFFNQQNACDIEVLAYRERRSWLGKTIIWNSFLDLYKEKGIIPDEVYKMMYREVSKEEVMFLEKWEQAIKDRYGIDPQVQSENTSFESESIRSELTVEGPEDSSLRVEDPRV